MLRPRPNLIALLLLLTFASACASQGASTPFRPPTLPPPTDLPPAAGATLTPAILPALSTSTITTTPTEGPCLNNLKFVSDVTIPDGTTVSIGSTIDKQWLVDNNGTCNWDSTYRLKWIGGDPMGADQEQFLHPVRAGKQANLRILLTAPTMEGTYESTWQAYGPDGIAFGDPIYLRVVAIP